MLLLGSIRSIMIICIRIDNIFFRKPTRPSLPLRKAPPFSPSLSSIVFTTPSVPLLGDRNPQGREDVTALRCSEPLRYKVGGASKPSPDCVGWDHRGVSGGYKFCFLFFCFWFFCLYSFRFGAERIEVFGIVEVCRGDDVCAA